MITIKDFMEVIEYKITEGTSFQWKCYGNDAYYLAHDNLATGTTINIIFDTTNQVVYEMQAWDGTRKKEYRWVHPSYKGDREIESNLRHISLTESIDNRNYVDLEVSKDMLEKASAIFKGEDYDKRVQIELEMTKEEQLLLMSMAHEKDMTLNHFVEYALMEHIKKLGLGIEL